MMWWGNNTWGHSWWWPGIIVMAIFMIICMAMMARMMSRGMPWSRPGNAGQRRPDGPERTLANRLASGEIDVEEYQRRLDALQQTTKTTRA
jgi:uncharacterized membrane protein